MVRSWNAIGTKYTPKAHANTPKTGFGDFRYTLPNKECRIIRPRFYKKAGVPFSRFVVRPLPLPYPDNPTSYTPFRFSQEAGDFGDWIYGAYIVPPIGRSGISFIIGDRRELDETTIADSPPAVLHRNLLRAVLAGEGDPAWGNNIVVQPNRDRIDNERAILYPPQFVYFIQCYVLMHPELPLSTKMYGGEENDPLFIACLPTSAGEEFLKQLDLLPAGLDAIAPTSGIFVDVHPPDEKPSEYITTSEDTRWGFHVSLYSTTINLLSGQPITAKLCDNEDSYNLNTVHWSEIIALPTIEEQVAWLCESDIPAAALVYGLRERFGQYIPQSVLDRATKTSDYKSVEHPAEHKIIHPVAMPHNIRKQASNISTLQSCRSACSCNNEETVPESLPPQKTSRSAQYDAVIAALRAAKTKQ